MANLLTCLRIICSIALLFCDTFSTPFFVLYIFAGFSDMIDGTVARKTRSASAFGSQLDTIADMTMAVVCMIKILPVLNMEVWMYIWILITVIIKVINLVLGYVLQKKLVTIHSLANKITGALLFALPLFWRVIELKYMVIIVGAVAIFAAVQEGYYIQTKRDVEYVGYNFKIKR